MLASHLRQMSSKPSRVYNFTSILCTIYFYTAAFCLCWSLLLRHTWSYGTGLLSHLASPIHSCSWWAADLPHCRSSWPLLTILVASSSTLTLETGHTWPSPVLGLAAIGEWLKIKLGESSGSIYIWLATGSHTLVTVYSARAFLACSDVYWILIYSSSLQFSLAPHPYACFSWHLRQTSSQPSKL